VSIDGTSVEVAVGETVEGVVVAATRAGLLEGLGRKLAALPAIATAVRSGDTLTLTGEANQPFTISAPSVYSLVPTSLRTTAVSGTAVLTQAGTTVTQAAEVSFGQFVDGADYTLTLGAMTDNDAGSRTPALPAISAQTLTLRADAANPALDTLPEVVSALAALVRAHPLYDGLATLVTVSMPVAAQYNATSAALELSLAGGALTSSATRVYKALVDATPAISTDQSTSLTEMSLTLADTLSSGKVVVPFTDLQTAFNALALPTGHAVVGLKVTVDVDGAGTLVPPVTLTLGMPAGAGAQSISPSPAVPVMTMTAEVANARQPVSADLTFDETVNVAVTTVQAARATAEQISDIEVDVFRPGYVYRLKLAAIGGVASETQVSVTASALFPTRAAVLAELGRLLAVAHPLI
ncbi:MAG: hypothetical protein EB027_07485, partial [Actinobacteria bacterium]|nr:hypothetical protein [Actinomycetota bacterium]